jgi:5,10-methylenetetrahydromethanopterin reductase
MNRRGMVIYHGIQTGAELQEYGHIAETLGYESLWVTERYFHEETFSMLGFLAATTRHIKLGLGVTNPYTRHPALLAMACATLDRISGGRFVLGLGRSDRFVIEDRLRMPYQAPRQTLKETVQLLRQLLQGADVFNHPKLDRARLAIEPVQSPLPIYLAAIGPKALRLAGAVADGVLLNAYVPADYVHYAVEEIRQSAQQVGRDPEDIDIACMLVVRLTDDPSEQWVGLKERLVRLLAEPFVGEILLEKGGFDVDILSPLRVAFETNRPKQALSLISDDMVRAFYLIGSQKQCQDRILEYQQAGVKLPLLLPRLNQYRQVAEALAT